MGKIYVHLADGFEEIEAITTVDVLRRAELDVVSVSIMDGRAVTGIHGITVEADILFGDADYSSCDMIVLPGGGPGTERLAAHEGLDKQIRSFINDEKWVAAICAAPALVLGEKRLLSGKKAVCYAGMEDYLRGADVSFDPVVVDGKIITSRGPGTAIAFALELTKVLCGGEVSGRVASGMLVL